MDAEAQTFEFVAQIASDSLYDLSSQLRKVDKLTTRGSPAVLASGIAQLGSLSATATTKVQALLNLSNDNLTPIEKKHSQELSAELEQLLNRVKETQAKVTKELKRKAQTETTPLLEAPVEAPQLQVQIIDQLDQTQVDLHTALVSERDVEIAEIARSTQEINQIFKDLGVLITEQGQQLDNVEDNIAGIASNARQAGEQLVRAENYQRSRGKYTCMFLCFLLFLTVIVAISVLS